MSKEKEIGLTKLITILFLTIVMAAAFMPMTSFGAVSDEASDTKTVKEYPDSCSNTEVSLIKTSYLESIDGGYMRVFNKDSKVHVEYYDSDFKVTGKKSIKLELPIWGGFFKGEDAYYLVEGQNNKKGVDGTEVVRIIKYDTSWKRIGAGSVYAKEGWEYEIRYPFDYSNVNFTETGGNLYLITGREGYVDPQFGMGHQGMMLIRMNESTLDTEIVYGDFWHSFSQHITHNGSDVYLYEESEGNRATQLSLFDGNSTGTDYFDAKKKSFPVLEYGGDRDSAWAIPCYATADDVSVSGENVIGVGTSIDQSNYDNYDWDKDPYNIYLTVTPISDMEQEATKVIWLTNYKKGAKSFAGVNLTKVSDDRFLVLWEEYKNDYTPSDSGDPFSGHSIHYVFIDGAGNAVSKVFARKAAISDCHPIISGNKAIYYASTGFYDSGYDSTVFYSIDTETGDFSKKVYNRKSIETVSVSKVGKKTYTGTEIKPSVKLKAGGKVLNSGTDYSITYSNNVNVGKAKITIKGKGIYEGSFKVTFYIVPKGTKLKKVSAAKKALKVGWKKQTEQTTGYQIQYALNKKFSKGKKTVTLKKNTYSSKKITKLKAKS